MNIRKKLLKGGHLSEKKCLEILRLFCEDLTATEIADASNVSRVTINNYCRLIRSLIVTYCHRYSMPLRQGNKLPDSGFQGGSYYAFYYQNGKVMSEWLDHSFVLPETGDITAGPLHYHAVANSSNWNLHWAKGDGVDLSGVQEDISTFWMFTQARLQKFRGMNKNTTYLHIKESEFRYNHRDHDIFSLLVETIRNSGKESTGVRWQEQTERIPFV